jgi:feruloyl esterase
MFSRPLLRCASALLFSVSLQFLLCAQNSSQGGARPLDLPAVPPAIDCASVTAADVPEATSASIKITSAAVIDDGRTAPHCRVQAIVDGFAKFEVHLPVSEWKQRFLAGGGPAGTVQANGFATMSRQDIGNRGSEDAFANNYQARVDFAYRIVHLQVAAAKAFIAKYYGHGPKFSYYNACSEPGREGMMEVQRFPEDFDGVVTGCPPINDVINNGLFYAWNIRANTRADGTLIITPDKLPLLHQAVLQECDALDGLKDGLVSDPFGCHPKLTEIECKPGQNATSCLTTEQIHSALELYRGAHDDKGKKLEPVGVLPGSELHWTAVIAPNPPLPGRPTFSNDRDGTVFALRSEFSDPPLGKSWQLSDLKFDRASFDAFTKLHYLYDATDPDLTAFAKAGHKLIIWQGLADTNVLPAHTVLYYTALQKTMGVQAVDQFVRLYVLPGVGHCGGGDGPFIRDFLTPLQLWVERGLAPDVLPASHVASQAPAAATGASAEPNLTRPVYPYPYTSRYRGTGEIHDGNNFVRGPARPAPATLFSWWGANFYKPGYEKWCTAKGTVLECKSSR